MLLESPRKAGRRAAIREDQTTIEAIQKRTYIDYCYCVGCLNHKTNLVLEKAGKFSGTKSEKEFYSQIQKQK